MNDSLDSVVFNCILRRLESRRDDLFTLAGTTSSFEEWLNWEAYLACKAIPEWYCIAKPPYGGKDGFDVTDPEYRNCLGDLAVRRRELSGERWVFAEFALLHDGNSTTKWQEKIAADVKKLRSVPFVNDIRLLIVVASSHKTIETDQTWKRYLSGVEIWAKPTVLTQTIQLRPSGTLVAKAFRVE